jgi:hypothetical protein
MYLVSLLFSLVLLTAVPFLESRESSLCQFMSRMLHVMHQWLLRSHVFTKEKIFTTLAGYYLPGQAADYRQCYVTKFSVSFRNISTYAYDLMNANASHPPAPCHQCENSRSPLPTDAYSHIAFPPPTNPSHQTHFFFISSPKAKERAYLYSGLTKSAMVFGSPSFGWMK